MYFDSHAHYDDEKFNEDRNELLASMKEGGVDYIVNAGTTVDTSKTSRNLAEKYPFIYFAAGIHPEEIDNFSAENLDEIERLLHHEKAVAVGEIGLDYYWEKEKKAQQHEALRAQLDLARSLKKPVIIHERDACQDTMNVVMDYPDLRIVFHCFSGSWETAKIYLDKGWYLGFNGVITFKNARKAVEVAEKMPLNQMLIETDCPYLAPTPHRGKRNSSLNLPYIAQKIADIRGTEAEKIASITKENAFNFFDIKYN